MSCLVTIFAHGRAENIFRRHLPLWKRHEGELLVVCPKDDPIEFDYRLMVSASEGAGEVAHVRLATALGHALTRQCSHYAFFEYDSFYVEQALPFCQGFRATMMTNLEGAKFLSMRYPSFPWIVDHESLERMLAVANCYPEMTEHGHNDRWLGALAHLASVPMIDFKPKGFSVGTVEEENFGELKQAVANGAKAFHGIKKGWTFEYVMEKVGLTHLL